MARNNVMNIIFLLFLGIFTLYPSVLPAVQCSGETMELAYEGNRTAIKKAAENFAKAATTFNSKADAYISQCGEPKDQKIDAEIPDHNTSERVRLTGENFTKEEYWKNTVYYWSGVEPDSDNCKNLAAQVKQAKQIFDAARTQVVKEANRAQQVEEDVCQCDKFGADLLCASIKLVNNLVMNKCKEFPQYVAEFSVCPLCGIFKILLTTVAKVSKVAWDAVAGLLSDVVKACFLVLLAIEVLKAVSSIGGVKLSEFGKNILLLCAKAAIAILLLSNPRYIYGYFMSPVLESGLNMGVAIANSAGSGAHLTQNPLDKLSIPSDTFDSSVYDTVMSTVRAFGASASELPAIGRGLSCHAWDNFFGIPDVSMWLSGAIFYILGIMIWLAVSFYMIDCTVQIGMLSGLVPLLIACWPFKMTESYSYKGCKMLMNSFFSYVMIGIVLLISTQVCLGALTGSGSDIKEITRALNANDIDKLKELCDMGGFQLLILGACGIFAIKMIGTANDLADQFSKGSGSRIGSKMGGAVMGAATNLAKGAAKAGGHMAGTIGKHASNAVGLTAAVNKGADTIKGKWQKGWAKAGRGVGLGKYQNQQTGSGKEGAEGGENRPDERENKEPETPETTETTETMETPETPETPDTPKTPETPETPNQRDNGE